MRNAMKFYIDGAWVEPAHPRSMDVIDPATEESAGRISVGSVDDVDRAAAAAWRAFASFSRTSREERVGLLERIAAEYDRRAADLAAAVTREMGAPRWLSENAQVALGAGHLRTAVSVLGGYSFSEDRGTTCLVKEAIGVCGLITPWNWPLNQIVCKVAPALAVGCTVVLKPSEIAPFSAIVFAEILDAAGVPAGVFNLVNGDGPTVGAAISGHRLIDMVSFTGSTRAGVEIARNAAPTVKRVCQELGGKSPYIIMEDADFQSAVTAGVRKVMLNSGQSCNAPTRMLVPFGRLEEAAAIAKLAAEAVIVGDPTGNAWMGPVVSELQWNKVQGLIETGIAEGATLVTGGLGRPEGLERGYYVKPTVFADVTPVMTIAREEIFGPVLSIMGYDGVDQAVELANDTVYGLAAYVSGNDPVKMRAIASSLRAGQVTLNDAALDFTAPFGGYKQSGNGREWGGHAFAEFLETKAILGFNGADG